MEGGLDGPSCNLRKFKESFFIASANSSTLRSRGGSGAALVLVGAGAGFDVLEVGVFPLLDGPASVSKSSVVRDFCMVLSTKSSILALFLDGLERFCSLFRDFPIDMASFCKLVKENFSFSSTFTSYRRVQILLSEANLEETILPVYDGPAFPSLSGIPR